MQIQMCFGRAEVYVLFLFFFHLCLFSNFMALLQRELDCSAVQLAPTSPESLWLWAIISLKKDSFYESETPFSLL